MINGDNRKSLPFFKQFLYFPQCLAGHRKGRRGDLPIIPASLQAVSVPADDPNHETPSGFLNYLFWANLDYAKIASRLGGKIHFCDIGCGSGRYAAYMRKFSGNNFGSYTGADIYKHESFPEKDKHIMASAADAGKYIGENTNFVFSQSVLEHIEDDTEAVMAITRELLAGGKPFIQIHSVPASACLWLYLWHGWRQYSARNIGAMRDRLIGMGNVHVYAIPLGGRRAFLAHILFITIPQIFNYLFSKKDFVRNHSRTEKSALSDMQAKHSAFTNYWNIVIAHDAIDLGLKT